MICVSQRKSSSYLSTRLIMTLSFKPLSTLHFKQYSYILMNYGTLTIIYSFKRERERERLKNMKGGLPDFRLALSHELSLSNFICLWNSSLITQNIKLLSPNGEWNQRRKSYPDVLDP